MAKQDRTPGATWQSQKSSLTRDRIIISTLDCIIQFGYVQTTMVRIAKIAGVSQGSMQYHFPAKMDAIKAAVNYLHVKRRNDHQIDLANIPAGMNPMAHAIEIYWKHLNEGHFIAYQDLVIAARTDPELASVLKPSYQRFVKAWREDALKLVPAWNDTREQFELICDIGQYQMEGLAFGTLNRQIDPKRVRNVLEFTKQLLVEMMDEMGH
jgi:AcrR family transcriptional regulator